MKVQNSILIIASDGKLLVSNSIKHWNKSPDCAPPISPSPSYAYSHACETCRTFILSIALANVTSATNQINKIKKLIVPVNHWKEPSLQSNSITDHSHNYSITYKKTRVTIRKTSSNNRKLITGKCQYKSRNDEL